jgi:hypothetical protein
MSNASAFYTGLKGAKGPKKANSNRGGAQINTNALLAQFGGGTERGTNQHHTSVN